MIENAAQISLVAFVVATTIALSRVVLGGVPNRVVARDPMTIFGGCISGLLGVLHERELLLDVDVVLSLIAVVGTVAIARYVEARV